MCGRYNILTDADALITTFGILESNISLEPFEARYNISPSPKNTEISSLDNSKLTLVPIVRLNDEHQLVLKNAIWPLIPVWAGSSVPKYSTANARSDTMTTRSSYRNAWKKFQRCIVPATGFYEWQVVEGQRIKQPWHIRHRKQPVMGFAGLWERGWTDDGKPFESCTIVTTQANELMAEIHNSNQRMPVIIDPEIRDIWLGDDNESALELAVPYRDGELTAEPISTRINNPNYNKPDSLDRLNSVN